VIAHAGYNSGHLGYHAALSLLKKWVYWVGMESDIRDLCSSCLHCLPVRNGARIPRPLGEACHVKPNQVLHFEYLYIFPRRDRTIDPEWLFVMRDDFSGMVFMKPVAVSNTRATVEALLEWRSLFGRSEIYVSDQASYFLSETMKLFSQKMNTRQHYITAYAHYSNGSIEIINREIISLFRALISELRWDKHHWPWLVKLVEHTLNHRPQRRLGGHAPITVMSGLQPDNPLDAVFYNPSHLPSVGLNWNLIRFLVMLNC